MQHTVSIGYGEDGRIATTGFLQGSTPQTFTWQDMGKSSLPSVMVMPNGMTLEWGYEEKRDLVATMVYKRGATRVVEREYAYDSLARSVTRRTVRQGNTVNDSFAYNSCGELTAATVNGKVYGYSYDNIGNRKTAQEDAEEATAYTANPLNQYTAIWQGSGEEGESTESEADTFTPTYDADGNQTRIKTATGIWNVTYNAENRPIRFESADGATVIDCTYDYMGRRHTRKVTVNGTISNYLRYIYRGYLQIAAIDAISGVFRWFLFWDPTQPTATRPLAIRKDSTWYAYGWDLTKNVTEIFGKAGYLRTAYTYTPYGETTAAGDVTQPITWSSEYTDEELALIYYNYRHYNPTDGRWINRDPLIKSNKQSLYNYVANNPTFKVDIVGLFSNGDPISSIKVKRISIRYGQILDEILVPILKSKGFCLYQIFKYIPLPESVDINDIQQDGFRILIDQYLRNLPYTYDSYGHWWIEFGEESYGWWPTLINADIQTLIGVPGRLNGTDKDHKKGSASDTRDAHHGETADREYTPVVNAYRFKIGNYTFFDYTLDYGIKKGTKCKCATEEDIKSCIRGFAHQYHGNWAYPFGSNCHSFQEEMLSACCLKINE